MARWATFINRHGNPDAAWLTVDAGNYVDRARGGSGCSDKCAFLVTSYAGLHYDVLNIGKQEVWMGYETLVTMIDTTKTEFVSANLLDVKTKKPLANPTVIKDYGNFRVGIIGLINEGDFPAGTSLLDSTKLAIMPHLEAAQKYLPNLIKKTDAVVVLAELASDRIDTLVKQFPEIDLVISTGGLRTGESPAVMGSKTRVIGTGSSGYNGHYVMLEFNPQWKDSLGFTAFMDPLTDNYEEKGPWADKLAAFQAQPAQAAPTPTAVPGTPGAKTPTITPVPAGKEAPKQLTPQTSTSNQG